MTQPTINNSRVCPGCGKPIESKNGHKYDTVTDDTTGLIWHQLCYNLRDVSYKAIVAASEETYDEYDWYLAIYEFLYTRLPMPNPNWGKISDQLGRYKAQNHSYKEIYYALVYTFLVDKNDPKKSQGGIGILAYKFEESSAYWNAYLRETLKQKAAIEAAAKKEAELASRRLSTRHREEKPKRDIAAAFAAMMEGEDT